MLIRVFIKNFLSFDEETVLSLYPGKGTEQRHVIPGKKRDDIPALKTAVIYGANASGKSNFTKAIFFIKQLVAEGKPLAETLYQPFKLGNDEKKASKIELEIKIGDAQYAYGIDFNKNEIKEEWLVKINKRTEKLIYERKNYKQKVEVEFSNVKFENAKKRQFAEFLGEGTPRNRPFLKEAIERNLNFIDEMNEVYGWFINSLNVISPKSRVRGLEFNL